MLPSLPILIADDQRDVTEALRLLLKAEGLASVCVDSPDAAIDAVRTREFGCALLDLNYSRDTTSGGEGLALIGRLHALDPGLPMVAMTAWGTIDLAVRALKAGAADFIEKPWENARLLSVVVNQLKLRDAQRRQARLARENEILRGAEDGEFVADSPAMQRVLELIRRVAPSEANVLVLGENGTGKGVIAQLIHRNSARSAEAFVKVNMGGIAESVFESEMFGHVRGAFTDAKADRVGRFELADGGTLFLDEIGNIPLSQQPKLLRVLEDREFERLGSSRTQAADVRVVSATNADLGTDVARGAFRKDLLYRLNTVEIRLPPLRERGPDIVPMARAFLARYAERYRKPGLAFGAAAERSLLAYPWPGNVRELSHVVERAVLLAAAGPIAELDFGAPLEATVQSVSAATTSTAAASSPADAGPSLDALTLDEAEEIMVRRALERAQGNVQRAADMLGLSRAALYRRFEKYGIRGE